MEAMPRLPMLSFLLKQVHKPTSFSDFIKRTIVTQYGEDPAHFAAETYELDSLRAAATRPGHDLQGLAVLKRYSCQLQALARRFPQLGEQHVEDVVFQWLDLYSGGPIGVQDPSYEMAAVMYNIGALHTVLGADDARQTPEGMKMSCTHFQCAAGAFQYVQERLPQPSASDLNRGMMQFHVEVALAQAQECILEKSMVDNRKGIITAKVAAQVADYHRSARRCLENALKTGEYLSENVGDRQMKQWVEHVELKAPLFDAVSLLYRGMQAEEQQRMGERITLYQVASERLADAATVAKRISGADGKAVSECLAFITDVIGGKLNNAKRENEFIYHEKVPTIESLPDIKGASLVKGIPFDLTDKDVAGPDIFQKLIPMEAHEHASLYSAKKDELLRRLMSQVEEKDQELMVLLSSLQLQQLETMKPYLSGSASSIQLPQELVDCVASMHARPTAVPQLHEAMSQLSGMSVDLQDSLDELETMLKEEEDCDKQHTAVMGGRRPPSMILTELRREFAKYRDAHQHAAESDTALHRAISAHLPNLSLLAGPLEALVSQLPSVQALVQQPESTAAVEALQRMVDKVEQMRRQRSMLCGHLRDAIHSDDITKRVVTSAGDDVNAFMDRELDKHRKQAAVVEQNLAAQDNILRALTEANAAYAPTRQQASDLLTARETRVLELLHSHRALDELLAKGKQGVTFYTKLQESVSKLLTRARGVCKVHAEERTSSLVPPGDGGGTAPAPAAGGGPRLRDYLAAGYRAGDQPPRVRPSPLGSEQTDPACSAGYPAQMSQYSQPSAQEAAAGAGGYAAQMALYMQGGAAPAKPTAAPEAGGYAAQMAQYMQKGADARGGQEPASAPEPGGYAAEMAQLMQKGGGASAPSGYAAQMAQYMSCGYKPGAAAVSGGQPVAAQTGHGTDQSAARYPAHSAAAGYPPQQRQPGYGPQQGQPPHAGFSAPPPPPPPQQPYSGYPSQQPQADKAAVASGYPVPAQAGYPAASSAGQPLLATMPAGPHAPPGSLTVVSSQYGHHSSDPYLAFYGGGGYTSWTPYQTFSRPVAESPSGAAFSSSHRPLAAASPHGPAVHSHRASSSVAAAAEVPAAVYTPPRLVGTGPAQTSSRPSGIAPYALATGYPSPLGSPSPSSAQMPASLPGGAAGVAAVNGSAPAASGSYPPAQQHPSQTQQLSAAPTQTQAAKPGYNGPQTGYSSTAVASQYQSQQTAGYQQPVPGQYYPGYPYPAVPQQPAQQGPSQQQTLSQQERQQQHGSTQQQTLPQQQQQCGNSPQQAVPSQQQQQYGNTQQQPMPPQQQQQCGNSPQQAVPSQKQQQYGNTQQQPMPPQQQQTLPQQQQQHYGSTRHQAMPPQQQQQYWSTQQQAMPHQQQQYPTSQARAVHRQQYPNQQQQYPRSPPYSQQQTSQLPMPAPPQQNQVNLIQQQIYPQNQHPPYQQQQLPQQQSQQQQYTQMKPQQLSLQHPQQQPQQKQYPQQQQPQNYTQQQPQHPQHQSQIQPQQKVQQYPQHHHHQQPPKQPQHPQQQPQLELQHPQQLRQQPFHPQQQQQQQLPAVASVPQLPASDAAASLPRAAASDPAGLTAPRQPGQQPQSQLNTAQYVLPSHPAGPGQMAPPIQPSPAPQPQQARGGSTAPSKAGDAISQSVDLLAGLDLSAAAAASTPPRPQQQQTVSRAGSAPVSNTQLPGVRPQRQPSGGDLLTSAAAPTPAALLQPRVVTSETERQSREEAERERKKVLADADPYADSEKLSAFVQEVERMDKYVAGMTKKSLNGPTPLDSKWKELMDQQEVDSRRLQISVARCYPMKNRYQEVLPFDQSLVPVPLVRDDYINASRLPELTASAPSLIVTQAPLAVTQTDFWCMVWHHQVELVVCLLPDSELDGQIYWPTERGVTVPYGPVQLTLQSQSPTNGRVERIFSLLHTETKMSRVVIHLQFTGWPRAALPSSPAPLVQFAAEVLHYHQQQRSLLRPLAVHCSGGAGRSGVFCLLAAALAELRAGGGLLEPSTAAVLLHQARRHCLQDKHHLLFAYQAVLYAAQDFLMKRGILTSRATFDDPPGGGPSRGHSRHPSEDFLAATRSVGELQARLGVLSGPAAAATAPPSPGSVSSVSLPAVPPSPAAAAAVSEPAAAAVDRRSSAPLLCGPLAACLDPSTFELGGPAALEAKPEPPTAGHDPLSDLDPLWSLKK